MIAVPLRDKSALSVAKALVKHVFLVYRAGEILVHDGGNEFCDEIMQHISQLFGFQRFVVSPYRPPANGMVERVHATRRPFLTARRIGANLHHMWFSVTTLLTTHQ